MATLNVKGLPDALYRRLQKRARAQHRSVAQEVTHILTQVLDARAPESVLSLRGLGKAQWAGVDAVEHVEAERRSWS
jgi:plasmid stability protein